MKILYVHQYRTVNHGQFPPGVWYREPDQMDYEHRGMRVRIKRHHSLGHLCGYVQVPPDHPWFDKGYDDIDVHVHGALTYAGNLEEAHTHWFGFDCAHGGDLSPGMSRFGGMGVGEVYRNVKYLQHQCARLVRQLRGAKHG